MTSRRHSSGAAFSLFSFQDIITAVSGIMILLVLIFAVQVARQEQVKAREPVAPTPVAAERHPDRRDVIAALEARQDELEFEIRQSRTKESQERSAKRAAENVKEDIQVMRDSNQTVAERVAGLSEDYRKSLRELMERRFGARAGDKRPLIALCSTEAIRVGRFMAKPRDFTGPDKTTAFLSHAAQNSSAARGTYYEFVLRPSSAVYAWPLIKSVEGMGYEIAWRPIEEHEAFRFEVDVP